MDAKTHMNRRAMLAFLSGGVAQAAFAEAVTESPFPKARPEGFYKRAIPSVEALIKEANLSGQVSFAVAQAATGEMLEVHQPLLRLPPASVAKTVTGLYALEHLGVAHRFVTRVIATGPIENGVVQGDLVLVGGGDPALDTDGLAALVGQLKTAGVQGVTGRFTLYDSALPRIGEIDASQTEYASYNPTISGLNLNYNRVHFEWRREGADYRLRMDARAEENAPEVRIARMRISTRDRPVFDHEPGVSYDDWTVARGALGNGGARWLPVRLPARYAGEVFRTLAGAQGVRLGVAERIEALPQGVELARIESVALSEMVRDMLKYSTNLTAEVLGLSASLARDAEGGTLAASAAAMTTWARDRFGLRHLSFVDHSGLGGASEVSVTDLVQMLSAPGVDPMLAPLLKPIPMREKGEAADPAEVMAKTGTLDFVSALAGYAEAPGGHRFAFAIVAADEVRREAAKATGVEIPEGAKGFNARAKRLQRGLIRRWAGIYGDV